MDNRQSCSRNYLSGAPLQRLEGEDEEDVLQGKMKDAPRRNETGLPDNLKAGVESLSGYSLDDVRVHYNSSKPATVQALAYTQGTDIHVAPGQEKHLPHEAWHVAQQMAGRVSPTTNINGMPVNDNAALEHEADVMGEKALQRKPSNTPTQKGHGVEVAQRVIQREGEANGKFIYVLDISQLKGLEKDLVPYTGGRIKFTKYQNARLLSVGFHGCYMMAFHFTGNDENDAEIKKLFQGTAIPDSFDDETFYVAHVASDARNALYDAEERKLIVIDAIFRPYNNATQDFVVGGTTKEDKNMGKMDLSAGMEKRAPNTWIGSIYDQEKNPDKTGWIINERATIDGSQMNTQTQATKAYIYARVCLDAILAEKYDRMVVALGKLCEIKKALPSAIYIARDQILFSTDMTDPCKKDADYVYGNEGIVEFLDAIICGLEEDYILYLVKRIRDRSVRNSLDIQPAPPTDIPSIMTRL